MSANIILAAPHQNGFYKNGIIKTTYQSDWENVASKEWVSILQNIAHSQHDALVETLKNINQGKVINCPFPDTTNSTKIQELASLIDMWKYDECLSQIGISKLELDQDLNGAKNENQKNKGNNQYTIKPETKEEYIQRYLENIGWWLKKFWKDSMVYMRDTFLSNQEDTILISNFKHRSRRFQSYLAKEMLENLNWSNLPKRKIIVNNNKTEYFEWWDFRYVPKEKILFAWYNKWSSRNSKKGINFVKKEFWLENKNILIVQWKNAFHIDTFFSIVTSDDGKLVAGIVCKEVCSNLPEVKKFFASRKIPLHEISREYGIGLPTKNKANKGIQKIWSGTVNTLQINENLLSSDRFPNAVEKELEKLWIKRHIIPTSEFWKAGWWIHCLTNQL